MAATAQAAAVTSAYRAHQVHVRNTTVVAVAGIWAQVDPDDLTGSWAGLAPHASAVVGLAQTVTATAAGVYVAEFARAVLGKPVDVAQPGSYSGWTSTGVPLAAALYSASVTTTKIRIAQGVPVAVAMTSGQAALVRATGSVVLDAGRQAMTDVMTGTDHVTGWRRVSGGGCDACNAAATGAVHRDDTVLEVHPHCTCTAEPVLLDHPADRHPVGGENEPSPGPLEESEKDKGITA